MRQPRDLSRRRFLRQSATAAGSLAAFAAPAINVLGANETINVGCIGTGGRCMTLMQSLKKLPNVRMTAVCDIYDVHRETARKIAGSEATTTKRYQEILDRKDIDAVLIGSPDHWHVPMTIDACNAGKDVYVEKPLTHDLSEGPPVIDAQNRNQRIVQVGTQQRSMPHFQRAYDLIRAGRIGKVYKVHTSWNRNADRVRKGSLGIDPQKVDWKAFLGTAPDQPFDEYRFRNWRWFWDFGAGILSDLMVHHIDIVHWILDVEHPLQAVTIGDNFISKGIWETPDTTQTLMTYPNDLQVHFEGTFCNARYGEMIEFMGSDGTLYIDRGRYEIYPERNKGAYEEWILGSGPRGKDFYDQPDGELLHLTNWVECIRSRKKPNAPAEAGVSAASAAHLGNQALRKNTVATWRG